MLFLFIVEKLYGISARVLKNESDTNEKIFDKLSHLETTKNVKILRRNFKCFFDNFHFNGRIQIEMMLFIRRMKYSLEIIEERLLENGWKIVLRIKDRVICKAT